MARAVARPRARLPVARARPSWSTYSSASPGRLARWVHTRSSSRAVNRSAASRARSTTESSTTAPVRRRSGSTGQTISGQGVSSGRASSIASNRLVMGRSLPPHHGSGTTPTPCVSDDGRGRGRHSQSHEHAVPATPPPADPGLRDREGLEPRVEAQRHVVDLRGREHDRREGHDVLERARRGDQHVVDDLCDGDVVDVAEHRANPPAVALWKQGGHHVRRRLRGRDDTGIDGGGRCGAGRE